MSRGNILGSKPAEDPMDLMEAKNFGVTRDTEIRWEDRAVKSPLDKIIVFSFVAFILGFLQPQAMLILVSCFLMLLLLVPWLRLRAAGMLDEEWEEVKRADIAIDEAEDSVYSRGTGRERYLTGLVLDGIGPILPGNLGKLIRGLDAGFGFLLSVNLTPANLDHVVEEGVLADSLVTYLTRFNSNEQRKAYFYVRGGLWQSGVTVLSTSFEPSHLRVFESQVKGCLPASSFKKIDSKKLIRNLSEWGAVCVSPTFMAAGVELSDWLVQLPSELAPEIGSNVPGEFLSPIRQSPTDYRLGVTINPETLKDGPPVGLNHANIESGLLLCGGDWSHRHSVVTGLVQGLLDSGRRVLLITQEEEALRLAGLASGGIGMTLGRDFIVNPVDSEGVRRSKYVSELLLILEGLAGSNLSSAADFEIALNRVVALGNGTVADVTLGEFVEDPNGGPPQSQPPSRESRLAMNAIRRLHEGSGAQAFYGTQTATVKRISEHDLTVIAVSLESLDLTMFAIDMLCLKISGLERDPNLVVVLDSPGNLTVESSTYRYTKKNVLAFSTIKRLLRRGPLVVSLENPSSLPSECADAFGSCIALRLRDTQDIAAVSDLLSLSVVGGGIHSKKRVSSRESSFLRVMEPNFALLSHSEMKTCIPIRLDPPPALDDVSIEEIDKIESNDGPPEGRKKTLLETLGGNDSDTAMKVLSLLRKYEPLTEQSVTQFLKASGEPDPDVDSILARLEKASMILRGHETHGGVSYTNYRITMKGTMALHQAEEVAVQ